MDEIIAKEFDIKPQILPGSFTSNMMGVRDFVKERIEDYKNLTVSEESFRMAKDKRAEMNKAARMFDDEWKSCVNQFNAPLAEATALATEIKQIFKEADMILGGKIHEIDDGLRAQKVAAANEIKAKLIDETGDPELIEYAAECTWITKDQWSNKSYSEAQIKKDVEDAINQIKSALQLFQGEFRPQMLAAFKQTGDLGRVQIMGQELLKQKQEYEAKQKTPEKVVEQKPEPEPEQKAPEVDSNKKKICVADFRIRGERYKLEWLVDQCAKMGIELTRLDK